MPSPRDMMTSWWQNPENRAKPEPDQLTDVSTIIQQTAAKAGMKVDNDTVMQAATGILKAFKAQPAPEPTPDYGNKWATGLRVAGPMLGGLAGGAAGFLSPVPGGMAIGSRLGAAAGAAAAEYPAQKWAEGRKEFNPYEAAVEAAIAPIGGVGAKGFLSNIIKRAGEGALITGGGAYPRAWAAGREMPSAGEAATQAGTGALFGGAFGGVEGAGRAAIGAVRPRLGVDAPKAGPEFNADLGGGPVPPGPKPAGPGYGADFGQPPGGGGGGGGGGPQPGPRPQPGPAAGGAASGSADLDSVIGMVNDLVKDGKWQSGVPIGDMPDPARAQAMADMFNQHVASTGHPQRLIFNGKTMFMGMEGVGAPPVQQPGAGAAPAGPAESQPRIVPGTQQPPPGPPKPAAPPPPPAAPQGPLTGGYPPPPRPRKPEITVLPEGGAPPAPAAGGPAIKMPTTLAELQQLSPAAYQKMEEWGLAYQRGALNLKDLPSDEARKWFALYAKEKGINAGVPPAGKPAAAPPVAPAPAAAQAPPAPAAAAPPAPKANAEQLAAVTNDFYDEMAKQLSERGKVGPFTVTPSAPVLKQIEDRMRAGGHDASVTFESGHIVAKAAKGAKPPAAPPAAPAAQPPAAPAAPAAAAPPPAAPAAPAPAAPAQAGKPATAVAAKRVHPAKVYFKSIKELETRPDLKELVDKLGAIADAAKTGGPRLINGPKGAPDGEKRAQYAADVLNRYAILAPKPWSLMREGSDLRVVYPGELEGPAQPAEKKPNIKPVGGKIGTGEYDIMAGVPEAQQKLKATTGLDATLEKVAEGGRGAARVTVSGPSGPKTYAYPLKVKDKIQDGPSLLARGILQYQDDAKAGKIKAPTVEKLGEKTYGDQDIERAANWMAAKVGVLRENDKSSPTSSLIERVLASGDKDLAQQNIAPIVQQLTRNGKGSVFRVKVEDRIEQGVTPGVMREVRDRTAAAGKPVSPSEAQAPPVAPAEDSPPAVGAAGGDDIFSPDAQANFKKALDDYVNQPVPENGHALATQYLESKGILSEMRGQVRAGASNEDLDQAFAPKLEPNGLQKRHRLYHIFRQGEMPTGGPERRPGQNVPLGGAAEAHVPAAPFEGDGEAIVDHMAEVVKAAPAGMKGSVLGLLSEEAKTLPQVKAFTDWLAKQSPDRIEAFAAQVKRKAETGNRHATASEVAVEKGTSPATPPARVVSAPQIGPAVKKILSRYQVALLDDEGNLLKTRPANAGKPYTSLKNAEKYAEAHRIAGRLPRVWVTNGTETVPYTGQPGELEPILKAGTASVKAEVDAPTEPLQSAPPDELAGAEDLVGELPDDLDPDKINRMAGDMYAGTTPTAKEQKKPKPPPRPRKPPGK